VAKPGGRTGSQPILSELAVIIKMKKPPNSVLRGIATGQVLMKKEVAATLASASRIPKMAYFARAKYKNAHFLFINAHLYTSLERIRSSDSRPRYSIRRQSELDVGSGGLGIRTEESMEKKIRLIALSCG
jgi:hypothetical protein